MLMTRRRRFLHFFLSLPERIVRALAAGLGGLLFELSELLLPRAIRRSRLYQAVVYRLLRLTIELLGGVQGAMPHDDMAVNELAVRKTAGNVIELAGFFAIGWSPLWLLAATADLTGGTRAYLRLLVAELQKDGLLPAGSEVQSVDDLLSSLESSTAVMADLVDVPPLNVKELKASWQTLQKNAGTLPGPAQLANFYAQLQQVAGQEGRSLASLSSLVAAGAWRAGIQLGSAHIFDYYQEALMSIRQEGWLHYARRVAAPYMRTVGSYFDPGRLTYTEKMLSRLSSGRGQASPPQ